MLARLEVITVVLLTACTFVEVLADLFPTFISHECSPENREVVPCGEIVNFGQSNVTGDVYVALENGIYEFDQNLVPISFVFTTEPDGVQTNDLMVLTDKNLILCKKDRVGSCELRNLVSLDLMEGYDRTNVVRNHRKDVSLGWIGLGPDGVQKVLHVALSSGLSNSSSAPSISTRYLPDRKIPPTDFLAILENEYLVPSAQWIDLPQANDEIVPIYGFSNGNYDYLLKLQTATGGVSSSKLVRFCRKDINYRSYIELPLECISKEGDVFRDASSATLEGGDLIVSFSSRGTSVVCRYNITEINQQFQDRRRECLLGETATTQIEWYKVIPCPSGSIPDTVFNISDLYDPDYCYVLDTANPLGGNEPIQDDALLHVEFDVNGIAIGHFQGDTIYFLGDNNGRLIKMRKMFEIWETEFVSIVDGGSISAPGGLTLNTDRTAVFVMTERKLVKVPFEFTSETTPSNQPTQTKAPQGNDDQMLEPIFIYIICGASGVVVIVIVLVLAWSIKFGFRKYKLSGL